MEKNTAEDARPRWARALAYWSRRARIFPVELMACVGVGMAAGLAVLDGRIVPAPWLAERLASAVRMPPKARREWLAAVAAARGAGIAASAAHAGAPCAMVASGAAPVAVWCGLLAAGVDAGEADLIGGAILELLEGGR